MDFSLSAYCAVKQVNIIPILEIGEAQKNDLPTDTEETDASCMSRIYVLLAPSPVLLINLYMEHQN